MSNPEVMYIPVDVAAAHALPVNELRVLVRIRNNRLLTLREQCGFTQSQVAAAAGVSLQHVARIEKFGRLGHTRTLSHAVLWPSVKRIAAIFGVDPEQLAPADLFEAIRVVDVEREISRTDALALADSLGSVDLAALPSPEEPDDTAARHELGAQLERAISDVLTPREEIVIRGRLSGLLQSDIAPMVGVGAARVGQIETAAILKLGRELRTDLYRRDARHVDAAVMTKDEPK